MKTIQFSRAGVVQRSARDALLAFLVPALVLGMFSWALVCSAPIPIQEYSLEESEITLTVSADAQ